MQVCAVFAHSLLASKPKQVTSEFMEAWQDAVPPVSILSLILSDLPLTAVLIVNRETCASSPGKYSMQALQLLAWLNLQGRHAPCRKASTYTKTYKFCQTLMNGRNEQPP